MTTVTKMGFGSGVGVGDGSADGSSGGRSATGAEADVAILLVTFGVAVVGCRTVVVSGEGVADPPSTLTTA